MSDATLFNSGMFDLHSGEKSDFLIDCGALTDSDLETLAVQVALRFRYSTVHGIPRGGLRFAEALRKWSIPSVKLPRLVVDDVLTTGASMEQSRYNPTDVGVVIFARKKPPTWIHAIFTLEDTESISSLTEKLRNYKALVEEMADDERGPCHLDHHGYCQEHYGGFRDGGCWVAAARNLLSQDVSQDVKEN